MYHHYCTSGHCTLTTLWSANETDCHSQCVPDRENVAFLTFQRKACLLLISVIWRKNTIHPEYTQLWGSQLIDQPVCVHTCCVPTLWQSSGCTTRSIPGGPPLPKMSLHWWHLSLHTADGDRPSRPWGCDGTRRAPPPFLLLIKPAVFTGGYVQWHLGGWTTAVAVRYFINRPYVYPVMSPSCLCSDFLSWKTL